MYLFFDTETTGLPKNWQAPITDLDNWPRLVQIAWLLYDEAGKYIMERECIIKPEGFSIPKEASRVHGISTEKALKEGVDLADILAEFNFNLEESSSLIAHNLSFDQAIIEAEFLRKNINYNFKNINKICTKLASTDFCRLPKNNGYGYKWPNLQELHFKLFGRGFEDAHDALVDVRACADCFFKLKELSVI